MAMDNNKKSYNTNGYDKHGYNMYGFDKYGFDVRGVDEWETNGIDQKYFSGPVDYEIGHHLYTVGDITNQKDICIQKQERQARAWAYDKVIPIKDIHRAIQSGYYERWQIAEFLEVDEEMLGDAIRYYVEKGLL